jgi:hypothetical protein
MWLGDGGCCEWPTTYNGLLLLVTCCDGTCISPVTGVQYMEVCGCTSSLVKFRINSCGIFCEAPGYVAVSKLCCLCCRWS